MIVHPITDTHHIVVLKKGDEWQRALTEYIDSHDIKNASFFGIGAVEYLECGYYDLARRTYEFRRYDDLVEVVNLTGNIMLKEGAPFVHAHITCTDSENRAFGGHVSQLRVGVTLELSVTLLPSSLAREYDEETRLWLIAT